MPSSIDPYIMADIVELTVETVPVGDSESLAESALQNTVEKLDIENDEEVIISAEEGEKEAGTGQRGDDGILEGIAIFNDVNDEDRVSSDSENEEKGIVIHVSKATGGGKRVNKAYDRNVYVRQTVNIIDTKTESAASPTAMEATDESKNDVQTSQNEEELKKLRFHYHHTAFDINIDALEAEVKTWREPNADLSNYFNFGFDEKSWRNYAEIQLRLRDKLGKGPSYMKINIPPPAMMHTDGNVPIPGLSRFEKTLVGNESKKDLSNVIPTNPLVIPSVMPNPYGSAPPPPVPPAAIPHQAMNEEKSNNDSNYNSERGGRFNNDGGRGGRFNDGGRGGRDDKRRRDDSRDRDDAKRRRDDSRDRNYRRSNSRDRNNRRR